VRKSFILATTILIAGCGEERNVTTQQAAYPTLESCLSTMRSTAIQPFRIITDTPEEVSGFHGEQNLLFACLRKETGTQGVYFQGVIEIPN
jgi:hypothetical protein